MSVCIFWISKYFCQTVNTSTQTRNGIIGKVNTEDIFRSKEKFPECGYGPTVLFLVVTRGEVNFPRTKSSGNSSALCQTKICYKSKSNLNTAVFGAT